MLRHMNFVAHLVLGVYSLQRGSLILVTERKLKLSNVGMCFRFLHNVNKRCSDDEIRYIDKRF